MGITMTGTSGIDVSGLISQLTQLRQMEVTRKQEKKTAVNKQIDAYTKLGTYLSDFSTKASALKSKDDFNIYKTTSSNADTVGVSTSYGAQAGSYSVSVTQLAEKEKLVSNDMTISSMSVPLSQQGINPGKFKINGTEIEINASDTINDVRAKINNATDDKGKKIGVTATVLSPSEGNFRLILTSDETGAAGATYEDIDGSFLQDMGFINASGDKANVLNPGQDAAFSINGIDMTSSKNTINGVVAGLNFELKKVTTDTPVQISVGRDADGVAKKINDIIEQYNFLLKYSNEQTKFDASGDTPVRGTLFGDSTVRNVTQSLRNVFQAQIGGVDGSSFVTLSQLGITTDKKTGELVLDKDKLKEAMEKDFDGVVSVFITKGTSSNSSIQYGRSSAATQEGEYELEEENGTYKIRKKGDTDWTVGTRSGDIVSFGAGPAKGLMITAPEGSGNSTFAFSKGIAGRMDEKIKQLTDPIDGVVARKKEALQTRTRNIDSQIEMEQRRVDAYRERLVKQFAAMENTMRMLKSQQSAMFSQMGS